MGERSPYTTAKISSYEYSPRLVQLIARRYLTNRLVYNKLIYRKDTHERLEAHLPE
jgi:hypothetical protein